MIKPHLGFVILLVNNPIKSAAFYADLFNIKPVEQSPTFALFALSNGVLLGLWSRYTVEPRPEGNPGSVDICFPSDNIDNLYESFGKKGITIIQKLTDMDFGRTFVALDPDGHRIRMYTMKEEIA